MFCAANPRLTRQKKTEQAGSFFLALELTKLTSGSIVKQRSGLTKRPVFMQLHWDVPITLSIRKLEKTYLSGSWDIHVKFPFGVNKKERGGQWKIMKMA